MPSDNHVKAAFSLIEDKTKLLGLTIGIHENVQPGTWIPRNEAQELPRLSFAGANPTSTYLVVSLDIDAPFPAFGILSPILHWIQSDMKVTSDATLDAPHRYLFFLYEQPEDFDLTAYAPAGGKNLGNLSRMRYDFDAWAEEIKLGPPVAFNYFTCN
ncbi:hypothetical protein N7472_004079 [Penicillium cf. griseofulvum]|uniref:Uncharacterized protein n=1 Tax=Penicillium cf. griseofulvum TaxID=2972120 RepID=A0A9W9JKY2_9EURO|nr:hypothetical protein N7472_004079 [Penicillium cf. griseofulvum]